MDEANLTEDFIRAVRARINRARIAYLVQERDANTVHATRSELCNAMVAAAEAHGIPAAFFTSLLWRESGFRLKVVSPVGAQGVAQFMPATADSMGLDNPFNPFDAIPMSARLLAELYRQFGNYGLAAAAYNTGPARVVSWLEKRARLPQETVDYVRIITGKPVEQWRQPPEAVAFKAPPETGCPVTTTQMVKDNGAVQAVNIASVPLPPARPGAAMLTAAASSGPVAAAMEKDQSRIADAGATMPAGTDGPVLAAAVLLPQPRPSATARDADIAGAAKAANGAVAAARPAVRRIRVASADPGLPMVAAPSTKILAGATDPAPAAAAKGTPPRAGSASKPAGGGKAKASRRVRPPDGAGEHRPLRLVATR